MNNTPYAISESSSLVAKLIARTEENKIAWSDLSEPFATSAEKFEAELEGKLKVSIYSDRLVINFVVYLMQFAGGNRPLLSVSLEHDPSFGYDLPGESELHDKLIQLHELARRSALNVDQNLASARDILERLAG